MVVQWSHRTVNNSHKFSPSPLPADPETMYLHNPNNRLTLELRQDNKASTTVANLRGRAKAMPALSNPFLPSPATVVTLQPLAHNSEVAIL